MPNENNNNPNQPKGIQITPSQAIETVTSAVRQLRITYDEHVVLYNCLEVIKQHLSTTPINQEDTPKNLVSI